MNIALKITIIKSKKTQYEIAQEARIDYNRLSRIIHEYERPKEVEKFKLAKVFQCSVEDIFPQVEIAP